MNVEIAKQIIANVRAKVKVGKELYLCIALCDYLHHPGDVRGEWLQTGYELKARLLVLIQQDLNLPENANLTRSLVSLVHQYGPKKYRRIAHHGVVATRMRHDLLNRLEKELYK